MLRLIAMLFDFIGGLLAIMAPVAILHWVLKLMNIKEISDLVGFFDGFFEPLNALITALMPFTLPAFSAGKTSLSIAQLLTGLLLVGFFFLCAMLANGIRGAERQIKFTAASRPDERRQRKAELVKELKQREVQLANQVIILILYPFERNPGAAQVFGCYEQYGGSRKRARAEGWLLQFYSVEKGLNYLLHTGVQLFRYYQTLRPIDPRPPFRIAVHAVQGGDQYLFQGLELCERLIRYADENQMVISQLFYEQLTHNKLQDACRCQSIGLYEFSVNEDPQEVYKLLPPAKNKKRVGER